MSSQINPGVNEHLQPLPEAELSVLEYTERSSSRPRGEKIIQCIGAATFAMGVIEIRNGDLGQKARGAAEVAIGMLWMRR